LTPTGQIKIGRSTTYSRHYFFMSLPYSPSVQFILIFIPPVSVSLISIAHPSPSRSSSWILLFYSPFAFSDGSTQLLISSINSTASFARSLADFSKYCLSLTYSNPAFQNSHLVLKNPSKPLYNSRAQNTGLPTSESSHLLEGWACLSIPSKGRFLGKDFLYGDNLL
jgi:hypothetical protein